MRRNREPRARLFVRPFGLRSCETCHWGVGARLQIATSRYELNPMARHLSDGIPSVANILSRHENTCSQTQAPSWSLPELDRNFYEHVRLWYHEHERAPVPLTLAIGTTRPTWVLDRT